MSDVKDFWGSLSTNAKMGSVFAVVAVVAISIFMVSVLHQKEYGLLYSGLEEADAAEVVSKLKELKAEYKLSADGANVYVDADQIASLKLDLLNEGYQHGSGSGFELFDQSSYAMSDFTQKINYQRALQGELSRTISNLSEVKASRVHLVLPESRLFEKDKKHAKASVVLTLHKEKYLSLVQIEGIQNLVSSSVEGLQINNVIVSDNHGIVLSGSTQNRSNQAVAMLTEKGKIEADLVKKCKSILDHAFGKGRSVVNVNVSLATSEVHETKEMILPGSGSGEGLLTRSKTSVTKKNDSDARAKGSKYQVVQESTEKQFAVGKLVESSVKKPGDIERISVSALVPQSVTDSQLDSIRELLISAVGIVDPRGDSLAVERLPAFAASVVKQANPLQQSPPVPKKSEGLSRASYLELAQQYWGYGLGGILILVVVIVLLTRGSRNQYTLDSIEKQQLLLEIQDWLNEDEAVKDQA